MQFAGFRPVCAVKWDLYVEHSSNVVGHICHGEDICVKEHIPIM